MKKFWRSGMIDKKIVREREQDEYINKLHRTILELSREEPDASDLINGIDYDEVRVGDNVILDFNKQFNIKTPAYDALREWLKNRNNYDRYDADIAFSEKMKEIEDENNTRTLRQEE